MFDLIASKITPKVVIDVGAHVGNWHNEARLRWPDAHFILIEAQEACRPFLEATGAEHYIAVLSDKEKEVTFYNRKNDISTGASIYRENTPFFSDDQIEPEIRQATTLDDIISERIIFGRKPLNPKDILIKIDAQGSELDILKGGEFSLAMADAIVLELALSDYNQDAPSAQEVHDYLIEQEFVNYISLGNITHPLDPTKIIQEDRLYLR